MTVYELVFKLLQENEKYRNSDRELLWRIWTDEGYVQHGSLTKEAFLHVTHFESIRRARQKVQEQHPELQATQPVQEARKAKEQTKGDFIYVEKVAKPIIDLAPYEKEYKQIIKQQRESQYHFDGGLF